MSRGPDKQFDPQEALGKAMHLFWTKGYAATGMAELQQQMGIGRKSLYDTYGNKREFFIKALQLYSDSMVGGLESVLREDGSPLENVRRLLRLSGDASAAPDSKGCLLGVSMAEFSTGDPEMAEILRNHMKRIEDALYVTFKRAVEAGELDEGTKVRDVARLYTGILQGMYLIGRVQESPAVTRSIVNSALANLEGS